MENLRFFAIGTRMGLCPVLAYVAFCREEVVGWTVFTLKETPSSISGRARQLCLQTGRCMSVNMSRALSLVHHELWLPEIAARFKAEVRLPSIGHGFVANREALGDKKPGASPDGFIVAAPNAGDDDKRDRDFGDVPTCPFSGREQFCKGLCTIQTLVGLLGLPILCNCLDAR